MRFSPFQLTITDFESLPAETHPGISGTATWKVLFRDELRIRLVTFSPGYAADHWCSKGHIIFCVDGQMTTELEDGRKLELSGRQLFTVGDDIDAHRIFTETGCTLFIVD